MAIRGWLIIATKTIQLTPAKLNWNLAKQGKKRYNTATTTKLTIDILLLIPDLLMTIPKFKYSVEGLNIDPRNVFV